uniref:Domain X domain-containing protein n=1 Tax=Grateloupia angusta TaxID=1347085 RepID=V5JFR4_9FLOR|nr:hypothetical protein Grat.angu.mt.05 [Grateloupia angusta]AGO19285.1 hypothetical protein Grat.angu.mt.05 [Grateloupia angusta]
MYILKHSAYLSWANQKGTIACRKKRYWDSISWATLSMVRITNPFKQKGGKKVPNYYNNNCQLSVFFYIVMKIQKCLRTRNSVRIFNFVGDLRTDSDVLFKNSGNPDYWKIWGFGEIVVRKPTEGLRKGFSSVATQQFLLSGKKLIKVKLKEINIQAKNFMETGEKIQGLSDFLKIPEFLEECYYKIKSKESSWITKFNNTSINSINKVWFKNVSKKIVSGSITLSLAKRKLTSKSWDNTYSAEILFSENRIIHKALEQLLEIVFEKIFGNINLLGFKPVKTRRMALNQVYIQMGSSRWFIKGNISEYCNNINYSVLMSKLKKVIDDQLFIDVVYKILRNISDISYPEISLIQEKNIGLVLFNVCLYDFDLAVLKILKSFDKNKEIKLDHIKIIRSSSVELNQKLKKVRYVRYNGNFLIGINGSRNECAEIRSEIFKLVQSYFEPAFNSQKIKIAHASTDGVHFLGYNIRTLDLSKGKAENLQKKYKKTVASLANKLTMDVPIKQVVKKLVLIGYCKSSGNPTRCGRLIHKPLHIIIKEYLILESKLFSYYSMASNYKQLVKRIHYILKYSCALTFASKLKLKTLRKVFKKFGKDLTISFGKEKKDQISYSKISYKEFTKYR